MHSPQLAASAQGSLAVHSDASHDHPLHEPLSGPEELPVAQVPVSAHQPHG